jgi:hypothetical protein
MPAGKPGKHAPSECPVCGAAVPPNASACPDCGADERTGWNEEATRYDGLDLPESAFHPGESLQEDELKGRAARKSIPLFWWVVGIGLVVCLIYQVLSAGR